jgi:hypothetical protein
MSPYFIDFEAFQHGTGKYEMKELCVIDVDRPFSPLYFLFKSNKKWESLKMDQQKTYHYQSQYVHGIGWDEGEEYCCRKCVWRHIVETFPLCQNEIFYVMGEQKMDYLHNKFPKLNLCLYNVTMNTLPHLPPNITCIYRSHGEHCACLKCYRLVKHYAQLTD